MTSIQNAITDSGLILTVIVYRVDSVLKALHELIELVPWILKAQEVSFIIFILQTSEVRPHTSPIVRYSGNC